MRSSVLLAVITASVSLSPSPSATQEPSHAGAGRTTKGPLAAAIEQHIDNLVTTRPAAEPAGPTEEPERPGSDWAEVRALRPGQEILLRADTGIDGGRTFVFADAAELVVVHLAHPAVPASVRKWLREMAADRPAALLAARQQTTVTDREISIGGGVISQAGRTVGALDEVLQTIPRGEVHEIRLQRTRGSTLGAVAGAAAGVAAGLVLAPYWMMKPCGGGCADERFMLAASLVGLPVGGALVGYTPRQDQVIVYRSGP